MAKRNQMQMTACAMIISAMDVFPHMRVGQLIYNALSHAQQEGLFRGDLFYIPDDVLVDAINLYCKDFGKKQPPWEKELKDV